MKRLVIHTKSERALLGDIARSERTAVVYCGGSSVSRGMHRPKLDSPLQSAHWKIA